jgi:hypothetical protein
MILTCPHCNGELELRRKNNGGRPEPAPVAEILAARKLGATSAEIANAYGISRQRVHSIVQRFGGIST